VQDIEPSCLCDLLWIVPVSHTWNFRVPDQSRRTVPVPQTIPVSVPSPRLAQISTFLSKREVGSSHRGNIRLIETRGQSGHNLR
jgi:hypothetical protein